MIIPFFGKFTKTLAPDASPKEVELGEAKMEQVRLISSTA
jgi:hypothetical protein